MHTCIYMYVELVLWTSHSYPRYSGGKVGLVPGLNIGRVPAVPEIRRSIVSLRGPWLLAGTS